MYKIRPIAIYLPQFYPIEENNKVWGQGFTEWTNVSKAKPRFIGHYQPRLPADLGYYDLRLSEVREEQAKLARDYGINGFCYYHYWFNGKRVLEKPLDAVINLNKPDFPFMLCWANENWTKRWDGLDEEIILKQDYSIADDLEHINHLLKYFKCDNYIRINGKPVFVVYKAHLFPNIKETLAIWRKEAAKHNIELYLCYMEHRSYLGVDYISHGFDSAIEFMPYQMTSRYQDAVIRRLNIITKFFFNEEKIPFIYDYGRYVKNRCKENFPDYPRFPCVTPMWDNSCRRVGKSFFALKNSTPKLYKDWITCYLNKFRPKNNEENLFFINAWNEWAEGNYLEPDMKWGRQYLEATKEAFDEFESHNIYVNDIK
jgi:lipopolysaccharide biosynthesis protein